MNHDDNDRADLGAQQDDDAHELRMQLRGMRRESLPANDLWPSIAMRLGPQPAQSTDSASAGAAHPVMARRADKHVSRARRAPRRFAPFALAASLLLALGVAWQQRPHEGAGAASAEPGSIALQADAMTRQYEGALRELQAAGTSSAHANDALRQLDVSAAQIRNALAQDPDARFLLDRLRRTYEKRLEITQRDILA